MVHISQIMPAEGERPLLAAGEQVRVIRRYPIGIYRVRVTSATSEPSNGSSSRQLSITKRKGLGAMPDRGATTIVLPFR